MPGGQEAGVICHPCIHASVRRVAQVTAADVDEVGKV
jgi:hypothetical protein